MGSPMVGLDRMDVGTCVPMEPRERRKRSNSLQFFTVLCQLSDRKKIKSHRQGQGSVNQWVQKQWAKEVTLGLRMNRMV